jgi:hypothetical protein
MAVNVIHIDRIQDRIVAVVVGMLSSARAYGGRNLEYERGIRDTARAFAVAFGVEWRPLYRKIRKEMLEE